MKQTLFLTICFFSFSWYLNSSQEACPINTNGFATCERSCEKQHICKTYRYQDCHCEEGYFRDRINGKCVNRSECPIRSRVCPYSSSKHKRCEFDCHSHICVKKPNQRCHCSRHFYRDPRTFQCVRRHECTSKQSMGCVKHSAIGLHCERTCGDSYCRKRRGRYCYCKAGTYRNLVTGHCIKPRACPMRTCSPGLTCEHTCGETKCNNVTRDCYCKKHFYRQLSSMICVKKRFCQDSHETTKEPGKYSNATLFTTEVEVNNTYANVEMTEPELNVTDAEVQVTKPKIHVTDVGIQVTETKVQMTDIGIQATESKVHITTKVKTTTSVPVPTNDIIIGIPTIIDDATEEEEIEVYPMITRAKTKPTKTKRKGKPNQ